MRDFLPLLRSRAPVFWGVLLVALLLGFGTYTRGSLYAAWRMIRIESLSPGFVDLRGVTQPIDCVLSGKDPYTELGCEPFRSLRYNYPPLWLDLRYLGVTSRSTDWLGILITGVSLAALLVLFRARRRASAVVVFLAVISAPVLLAIERGNTDLVIFSLMVFGFFLIERLRVERRPSATCLLVVLLTVLKIFPVAMVAVLLESRRRLAVALAGATLAIAALLLTSGHRLPQILANTPRDTHSTFGAYPFFLVMAQHTVPVVIRRIKSGHWLASEGALLLACLSIGAGWAMRSKLNRFLPRLCFTSARGSMAVASLAIFCLVFAAGASYDYRLIFLLGALAYLVEDMNLGDSLRSLPACVCVLMFLWAPFQDRPLIDELLDGVIFCSACAWLGVTLMANLQAPKPVVDRAVSTLETRP